MGKYLGILVAVTGLVACKTTAPNSDVKDIGVVNTQDAKTKVIYEDQGKVYLKTCKPPLAPPLDRNCKTDETPKYLDVSVYLYKLPFDVGPYQRDAQGVALVTKALKDANDSVAGGNQNAVSTVQRLTPIKLNLEKILAVQDKLQANQNGLTYYEYHDEFSKLLAPFSEGAGGSPVWRDVTTTFDGAASNCEIVASRCTMQSKIRGLWWSKLQVPANWHAAVSHCQSLNHNGQTDWRLPTVEELTDAYKDGIKSAARTNWITEGDMDNGFWSGSSAFDGPNSAFNVFLASGRTYSYYKNSSNQVVCVR